MGSSKKYDVKGKKVRVFNNTMRDFLGGVGATAVSMAFAEVVPALNNGVVDCGVTGSLSGNTAGWPEVTKSLYPMSLGWSINIVATNLDRWNRLDKRVQAFMLEQLKAYENKMWDTLKKATAEADNCNTGKQPCTMGKLAKMTIVPVKPQTYTTAASGVTASRPSPPASSPIRSGSKNVSTRPTCPVQSGLCAGRLIDGR